MATKWQGEGKEEQSMSHMHTRTRKHATPNGCGMPICAANLIAGVMIVSSPHMASSKREVAFGANAGWRHWTCFKTIP